jgi:hypothetical protein
MPNNLNQLLTQRQALLTELQAIDRLRRGTLSRQVYSKKGDPSWTRGPYFVLQGFHKGKKFSRRVPAAQADQVQQQVNNFKRFQELADQCITLTDQITQLDQGLQESKKTPALGSSARAIPGNQGLPEISAAELCLSSPMEQPRRGR